MSVQEFNMWMAYFELQHEKTEQQKRLMKHQMEQPDAKNML